MKKYANLFSDYLYKKEKTLEDDEYELLVDLFRLVHSVGARSEIMRLRKDLKKVGGYGAATKV